MTETLGPSHIRYDEPSGIISSRWDGPTGSFSSASIYGLKFGHWMLRLDIIDDPIGTARRRLSKTVPDLIAVLNSDDRFKRMVALEELGKLGAAATPALPDLIGQMDNNDYSPVEAISRIAAQAGAAALPALTNGLKSSSAFVRARIAELLPTLGEAFSPSVPALRQRLTDAPSVRLHVASALWRFTGDTNEPLPVLAALLSDRDPQIAAGAASALGEMGLQAQAAVPALTTALRNNDWAVRATAARALGVIGPAAASAAPELINRLRQVQPSERGENLELPFLVDALGQLGSKASAAVPRLAWLARGENPQIAACSLKALGEMGPDAVPALLEILQMNSSPFKLSYTANALGRIGPTALSAAPRLREWLGADVHSGLRASAALALWKMGQRDDSIIQTLIDCLSDDAGCLGAVKALADIRPPAKAAIPALEAARTGHLGGVRREMETALARITAPPAEGNAK
jgi:HEAT repeat protein